jgi:hypothetical protein
MIIKFQSRDTWVVFGEVNHVEYSDIGYNPHDCAVRSEVIVFESPNNQAAQGKWIAMGFFTKNMDEPKEIIACTPIYLMNDQGKTIEVI